MCEVFETTILPWYSKTNNELEIRTKPKKKPENEPKKTPKKKPKMSNKPSNKNPDDSKP